ncbi:hypothetical protein [Leuconostoc citreum]|uniref:hypothetical protein n=1 Tax=Leuconostoc citreum TaxID=33964 RepID=UPI0032E0524B
MSNKFKLILKYILKSARYSFYIGGCLFFFIGLSIVSIVPSIKSTDFSHLTPDKMAKATFMVQNFWIGLMGTAIGLSIFFTLIELFADHRFRR